MLLLLIGDDDSHHKPTKSNHDNRWIGEEGLRSLGEGNEEIKVEPKKQGMKCQTNSPAPVWGTVKINHTKLSIRD
jgi:hypothetical protein